MSGRAQRERDIRRGVRSRGTKLCRGSRSTTRSVGGERFPRHRIHACRPSCRCLLHLRVEENARLLLLPQSGIL
jgi:hypothetical protein